MKTYVGLKEKAKPTIFESEREPSKGTDPNTTLFTVPSNRGKTQKDTLTLWANSPAAVVKKIVQ